MDSDCSLRNASATVEIEFVLNKNKEWAIRQVARDPEFFHRLVNTQRPEWMWIGCADSRVPVSRMAGQLPRGGLENTAEAS
jgi:carbonic anhydrase